MKRPQLLFCFVLLFILISKIPAQENWTHFRGSNLNAIASDIQIPLKWDSLTFRWKVAIHGRGYSSPVIYGNQVWLTTASKDGKELYAVCLDFETGKIIHDIKVFTPENVEGKNSINTYASPTPCIEKGFVYVHFGSMGTACINTSDGTVAWKRTDLYCKHVQGPGSSPILYKDLLILHYEGTDVRFLIALDKHTGKEVWRTYRPDEPYKALTVIGRKAYMTPLIINVKGKDLLVSVGSALCGAYNPDNGQEIWRVVRGGESTVSMPVSENGIIYFYTGYMVDDASPKFTEYLAVNADGTGDITSTNILWRRRDDQANNQMLSPVIKNGLIYTITTKKIMMCLDAKTGKEIWSARQKDEFNASPVYSNGNIWFFSTRGEAIAVKAGTTLDVISDNHMDSGIWATPAFLRNSVILRTENYLYRISSAN